MPRTAAEELLWWKRRCLPMLSLRPRLPYWSYLVSYLVSHLPRDSLLVRGGVLGGWGLVRLSLSRMSLGVGLASLPMGHWPMLPENEF